eukprot:TRINITY_DN4681_c0_g1_i2.p1 TRINITY_DN4681_c0_g1~~TRINITY_DN4681_c0_g1_i2.p1  ORF type:complete len:202 (-),score=41.21 TRINITY_DN4681_c0_g1_i2:366-971(-)
MSKQVVVVGSCNMDLVTRVSRFPLPGETIIGNKFFTTYGGKGANQAVAASILGAQTTMIGKVGDDGFGTECIDNFKNQGIDCQNVLVSQNSATGIAAITVVDDGENSIIIASGANMELTVNEIGQLSSVITDHKILLTQLELDLDTTIKALEIAHDSGVVTILNTGIILLIHLIHIYKLLQLSYQNLYTNILILFVLMKLN